MNLDDPSKPEFASWNSYQKFARRVQHGRRFVWQNEVQAFLDTVLATLKARDVKLPEDMILYRAQRGVEDVPVFDNDGVPIGEEPGPFGPARMKPVANRAREGRANPEGIPVLYLASSTETAISEVRPWVGSKISVGQFKILRDLKVLNLSRGHGEFSIDQLTFEQLTGEEPLNADTKEECVWIDIDNAFSRPVTLSDYAADYVPTQILAELFKDAGYEGIVYRSQFGKKGYNIALFDINDADAVNGVPFVVDGIEVKYEQIGGALFFNKTSGRKEK